MTERTNVWSNSNDATINNVYADSNIDGDRIDGDWDVLPVALNRDSKQFGVLHRCRTQVFHSAGNPTSVYRSYSVYLNSTDIIFSRGQLIS